MANPRRQSASTLVLSLILLGGGFFQARAATRVAEYSGIVQVRAAAYQSWEIVKAAPMDLAAGDSVRTGSKAHASVLFDDGSRIELGENGSFTLEASDDKRSGVHLNIGALRAFIAKLGARRFQVRTPTSVCSVRGTEFQVAVAPGGHTTVDLFKGLLAVEDHHGQQVLLHPNERVEVDHRGMGPMQVIPTHGMLQRAQFHALMQHEMTLDLSKNQVLAAAAQEKKLAEYQQGKTLIDVSGNRVRLDEYIVRPAANQFKLVVLNDRKDTFNYFYYLGTFNQALPRDLSAALRQLPGSADKAPDFFLTGFETGRSNTIDSMVEVAKGGHPVDVNHNNSTTDNVSSMFNRDTNTFDDVSGKSVFQTIFDNYGFYINGKLKYGWTGNNAQSYNDVTASATTDPITGAALASALPTRSVSVTFPDPGKIHQVIYESYSDGTATQWDNYIIDDQGRMATNADFAGVTPGISFQQKLLQFNYEQTVSASEFSGRKIDLVVEPKIFVQSGLIQ